MAAALGVLLLTPGAHGQSLYEKRQAIDGKISSLRTTIDSARELGAEVARFGELHVSLARLRADVQAGSRTVRDIRDR